MGALMFAAPFAIFPIGQQYVASGVAGIVNALTPVAVVIVSHLWPGGERATPLKAAGVLAGFAGIVLLTLPAMASGEDSRLFGTLVLILAPVSFAIAMNWVRRLGGIHPTVLVTWAFGFGAALLLPLVLALEGVPRIATPGGWAAVAVIGPVLTGLTFAMAFAIMARAGATKTSTVTFIAPVSALVIAKLVLDEDLTALHFAGMAAIFAGLFLIDGRLFRRSAREKLN
jgi:drug/metabolite transporter (DMT)-like permease